MMKRRDFLTASALTLPLALSAGANNGTTADTPRQLIELRTYEVQFGGSGASVLTTYLRDVFTPALERLGCPKPLLMRERGDDQPARYWLLITYPDANTYLLAQHLNADPAYREAAAKYNQVPAAKPVYSRFSSQLLHAFQGMPRVIVPGPESGLFELRTYEGYSEDAVRRKTAMFNDAELSIFLRVGLNPVFFGKMIAGPYRPALVYMLHFRDESDRNASFKRFGNDPEWTRVKAEEKYADTVSNIRRTFLIPA